MGLLDGIFGKDKKSMENSVFEKFVTQFPPSKELTKPTKEMLDWYEDKLPKELLEFWKQYGFGNYGNGLLKVIEPSEYMDVFYPWLGIEEDFSKLPILMTGFGDIYYYRKLSQDDEDISILDIHHRNIDVCTYSLDDFFNGYIVDKEIYDEDLKVELFNESVKRKGALKEDEIFFFVPALVMGGSENAEFVDKGNAFVHQSILLKMG